MKEIYRLLIDNTYITVIFMYLYLYTRNIQFYCTYTIRCLNLRKLLLRGKRIAHDMRLTYTHTQYTCEAKASESIRMCVRKSLANDGVVGSVEA